MRNPAIWAQLLCASRSILRLVGGEQNYYCRAAATGRRYRAVLFFGATLVGVSGLFGGSLIYGLNQYAF
ncbi:hypothetical protein YTPLAS18_40230 [Nitrospira sp.]|nr:hypothetical protein YTPLAS18_40230 [Nitrospira sp.]